MDKLIEEIEKTDRWMSEQFQKHDYREMYEIWNKFKEEALKQVKLGLSDVDSTTSNSNIPLQNHLLFIFPKKISVLGDDIKKGTCLIGNRSSLGTAYFQFYDSISGMLMTKSLVFGTVYGGQLYYNKKKVTLGDLLDELHYARNKDSFKGDFICIGDDKII